MTNENRNANNYFISGENITQDIPFIHISHQDAATIGMQNIIKNELYSFRLYYRNLTHCKDPEILHQLRVSLRRLRCAMGFLKKLRPSPKLNELIQTAKNIGYALGPIRELDVLKEFITSKTLSQHYNHEVFKPLLIALNRLREEELLKAISNLNNIQAEKFYEDLNKHLLLNVSKSKSSDYKSYSLVDFSELILYQLYKKSTSFKRNIEELSDEERHDLRISLKKLRYASEFFRDFFGHSKTKRFIRKICKLQDLLGYRNDVLATKRLVLKIGRYHGADISESLRLIQEYNDKICLGLEKKIASEWKNFRKAHSYWG